MTTLAAVPMGARSGSTADRDLAVLENAWFHLLRASGVRVADCGEACEFLFEGLRRAGVAVSDSREARLLLLEGALLHGLRLAGSEVVDSHGLRMELGLPT